MCFWSIAVVRGLKCYPAGYLGCVLSACPWLEQLDGKSAKDLRSGACPLPRVAEAPALRALLWGYLPRAGRRGLLLT